MRKTIFITIALSLALCSITWAIPASDNMSATQQVTTQYFGFYTDVNPIVTAQFIVGSPTEPIPVSYDSSYGPWIKEFILEPDSIGVAPNIINITEYLIIDEPVAWTDWHESIHPDYQSLYDFADNISLDFTMNTPPIDPLDIGIFIEIGSGGGVEGFTLLFDPALEVGTIFTIEKTLIFEGNGLTNNSNGNGTFLKLVEYPTSSSVPEPSTILLFGFGLAGIGLLSGRFKN